MNGHTIQNIEEYKAKREALLKEAFDLKYDGLQFSSDELKANEKFLAICKDTKSKLDEKFHFRPILYRNIVESSTLYKLLTDLPKGCQQHSHNPCNLQSKWFVTYCFNPNVYIDDSGRINVFEEAPKEGAWKNLLKVREEAQNKEEFDKTLEDYFHFTLEDFDSSAVWDRFEFKIANRMNICFQSEEIWEQYMTDTFIAAIEEGYSNFQIRNTLPFFEHKCFMDPEKEAQRYRRCLAKAREKDPNFTVGITLSTLRFFDLEKARKFLDLAYDFSKRYSDVIMGFDLVAEENRQTAEFFSPMFLEHRKVEKEEGHDLPLILHGGESLDVGNTNLYDLYLINAKRIGHGLNLFKHPYLIPKIKEKGICIEVNPLSNQILKYVSDLRLHPAIGYHNFGVKISISSDDIGIFNLYTIWDFFCIAISFEFDLLDMKRVILNSIETSCLEKSVQEELHKDWQNKWDAFISKVNSNKYV